MHPRLRSSLHYLLLAIVGAWLGAALELIDVAALRPWTPAPFWQAARELALLWTVAALCIAALRLLARRRAPPEAAFLCGPIGWLAASLLVQIDAQGRVSTTVIGATGLCALAVLLFLHAKLEGALAKIALLRQPLLFVLLAGGALGWAVRTWKRTTPQLADAAPRATTSPATASQASAAPSVLWVSIDTLRADRVGVYGNRDGLTPHLDALAKESVLFEDLTCPMPLTAPSHTAMLTGLPPHESGVRKNGIPLARSTPSLPRLLAEKEGYQTAGFVSGFPLFERSSHFASHFHWYDDEFDADAPLSEGARMTPFGNLGLRALRRKQPWKEPLERHGDQTIARAIDWLTNEADRARPFFAFVHLYDVHGEYMPHVPGLRRSHFFDLSEPYERLQFIDDPENRRLLEQLYDGEVTFVDGQVERLFEALRKSDRWSKTVVLVTADHGESLGEHDYWYDHITPYHVETHVLALLKLPNGERGGTRVSGPAQTTDLAATVRDLVGGSFEIPGQSLVGAIESGRIPRRLIDCQTIFDSANAWIIVSVRDGRFKLLRRSPAFQRFDSRRLAGGEELFDLVADPGETHDLIAAGAVPEEARLEELHDHLDGYFQTCLKLGPVVLDPEVEENLRKLGYGK